MIASPDDAGSSSDFESLTIDDEGMLILVWPHGVSITGPAARHAMDEVNRICGTTRRPMLVDMATTKSVSREARVVFGERCAASRIAMLGRSPVDRVIANFALGSEYRRGHPVRRSSSPIEPKPLRSFGKA